ncbi:MAG: DUF1326 domain-containing protein [Acidimicrobiia bacterium]
MVRTGAGITRDRTYALDGVILDACQRDERDPGPDDSRPACRSVAALLLGTGLVAGVDVSGLAVITAGERRATAGLLQRLVLVDERATPEQVRVLLDLVEGRIGGGLLATLAGPADRDLGVYQVPAAWVLEPERATVTVPGHLELSVTAGSADMTVDIPEHDLSWQVSGCEGLRGGIHVAGTIQAANPGAG